MFDLSGRVALVTGGSKGLGKAMARGFAEAGARVVISARHEAHDAYSATKSALLGLARASALDLGPFNITVNCIAPGPFRTDLPMRVLTEEQQKKFVEPTALGRWDAGASPVSWWGRRCFSPATRAATSPVPPC